MTNIYKKIKINWTYPIQPTSLQVGTVKIYRGTSEFTLDNVLSQTELVTKTYDPSFTEFIDDFELQEDTTYYYMIIVYGDIDSSISAATSLYSIKIEAPKVESTPFQFKIHAKSQDAWLDLNSISEEPGTIVEVDWGDGSEVVVWTPDENFTPFHEYALGTQCFATVTVNQPIGKLYMNGPAVAEFNEFGNLPVQDLKFNFGQMTKVPETFPSFITRTNYMFGNCLELNDPNISNWDTSNITSMQGMFEGCKKLNQPLNWDVSNVTDMKYLFAECSAFNQDLSNWCVSNITSKPNGFNDSAPLLTADKHPVWGTCPNG